MPDLVILIHKSQGEARAETKTGKLVATQHAKYFATLRPSPEGHAYFTTPTKSSVGNVKRHVEELFGPLDWRGMPGIEGVYGMAYVKY